ncbi:MAG: hypothetical protein ABSC48_13120 [Terracidiphilus sp.]
MALPTFGQGTAQAPRRSMQSQVPYTMEFKDTRVKTLANGTTIASESTEVRAVDSKGRILVSTTGFVASGGQKRKTFVTVTDPVAGTSTSWTSPGASATVSTLHKHQSLLSGCFVFYPAMPDSTSDAPAGGETSKPDRGVTDKPASGAARSSIGFVPGGVRPEQPVFATVIEDLGTATIQGVKAHGKRITRTTPVGKAGNDVPLVSTEESWIATELGPESPALRHDTDDPEFGQSTRELVYLSLDEPDLSTFLPPEGYEIVNITSKEMQPAPCPKELKQE